jgi:23S rRNA pseudouridine2605 synthase
VRTAPRDPSIMRLQAFLARAGAAPSRRKAEALICAGRVSVNGERATLGTAVSPQEDAVLLDGERITLPQSLVYLALNKPAGYLTTLKDEPGRNRPTVRDLMPPVPGLIPIGRLDAKTTGLLLLTNDGPLAHHISHPSSQIEKEYEVRVRNPAPESALAALSAGPTLEDGKMVPPKLTNIHTSSAREITFHLTIHEGRNRIIRRACRAVGLEVLSLRRIRIGPITLRGLPEGHIRELTEEEVETLGGHAR